MPKKPDARSDRVTYDVDTGVFSHVDTQPMRRLQEDAAVKVAKEPAPAPRVEGFDPYSTATTSPMVSSEKPRRTLDDMRKLSEEIKRNRERK
jgi:hypothetical protein